MTDAQKLKQLEDWLITNPEHPDRLPVWQNKIALENQIKNSNNEQSTASKTI